MILPFLEKLETGSRIFLIAGKSFNILQSPKSVGLPVGGVKEVELTTSELRALEYNHRRILSARGAAAIISDSIVVNTGSALPEGQVNLVDLVLNKKGKIVRIGQLKTMDPYIKNMVNRRQYTHLKLQVKLQKTVIGESFKIEVPEKTVISAEQRKLFGELVGDLNAFAEKCANMEKTLGRVVSPQEKLTLLNAYRAMRRGDVAGANAILERAGDTKGKFFPPKETDFLMRNGICGKPIEPVKDITVYHGTTGPAVKTHNLQMWGPDPNKNFYVTPDLDVAKRAAGPNGIVLEYRIPEKLAFEILGKERPYLGTLGKGTEHIIIGERAKQLHKYLNPKQKLPPY